MKIRIVIYNEELFISDSLDFEMNWDLPFLPRIGESIHALVFFRKNSLNYNIVYPELREDKKKELSDYMALHNEDKEESLKQWLWGSYLEDNMIYNILYSPVNNGDRNSDIVPKIYIDNQHE